FAGPEKGPCLFWEKEWCPINSQKYREKIVRLIDGIVSMRPWLSVMQDNAPAHTANSPDLNPTEAVWNKMKDYIQHLHPNLGCGKQRTNDSLRKIVKETWDPVSSEDLVRLIQSMPSRCQAVIDEDGGPTKYQGLKIFQPRVQIQG
ncbi:Bgt-50517, partial [Blumeria graminis f. sp. tritici]